MIIFAAKAIAFDAYGTLCYVSSPKDPYHRLLNLKSTSATILRRELMTSCKNLKDVVGKWGIDQPEVVAQIENLVDQEVESVQPFPEVIDTLMRLKKKGFGLAIVSNLSPPCAEPIKRYFSLLVDHFVFSFEVGAIKPEPKIFQVLCEKLETAPAEIVIVGDSMKSDIQGAKQFGMQVIHIDRKLAKAHPEKNSNDIPHIGKVIELVEKSLRL